MPYYTAYVTYRAIQILCDHGADHLLTDIEGNFPKDLAEKNHHSKCSKYLTSLGKNKPVKMRTSTAKMVSGFIKDYPFQCCYKGTTREKRVETATEC